MKKVLIIVYYWPPSGGAGVQRWLKFVKYLPQIGWQPIILTVDPQYASYAQIDESLFSEINQDIRVIKTRTFEIYNLYKRLTNSPEIPYGGFSNEKKETFISKVSKIIRGNFFIPDPRKGWNKYAIKEAAYLIRENEINTVITTSPPHSTQLIGLKLKKKFHIHWVADFRDPWTDIYYQKNLKQSNLIYKINLYYEKKVLRNADKVLTVSKEIKQSLIDKGKLNDPSKITVIMNGYDKNDFKFVKTVKNEKFVITYTGTLSEFYDLSGFIGAISSLDRESRQKIQLRFIGNHFIPIIRIIQEEISDVEINLIGYVKHSESIKYLMMSNLQLLVIPKVADNKGIVTGKIFEYLGSGIPVLGIGPVDGEAAAILKETKSGKMFTYEDEVGISDFIEKQISSKTKKKSKKIEKYSRKEQTKLLAEILSKP